MGKLIIYIVIGMFISHSGGYLQAQTYMEKQIIKNQDRAKYWSSKGFKFDSEYMTAYSMDQKVKDIKRSKYWKKQGYSFDPEYMTAYSMNQKVKDIKQSRYWKKQGYSFDPEYMTAYSMNQKVKDIKRSKYWKKQGYSFDPEYMTVYSMNQKVKDIKRSKYWKKQGYNFDPEYMSAYSMDQKVKVLNISTNKKVTKNIRVPKLKIMAKTETIIKTSTKPRTIVKLLVNPKKKKARKLILKIPIKSNNQPNLRQYENRRVYICSELSRSEAYSLLSLGHTYLDRDGDGHPCEWGQVESSYSSNCHYVNGYYRKSGTYVSGYTRCR